MEIIRGDNMFYIGEPEKPSAYVKFHVDGNILHLNSTVVGEKFKGQGVGKKLVAEVVSYAIEMGYKVNPVCWFAEVYFEKNPELAKYKA